jgi:hypothetical protein
VPVWTVLRMSRKHGPLQVAPVLFVYVGASHVSMRPRAHKADLYFE